MRFPFETALAHCAAIVLLALAPMPALGQSYDCVIRPSQLVRIGASVSGVLAAVPVNRGDWVEAGDVVARLDTTLEDMAIRLAELRAKSTAGLEAAEARVAFLAGRLERNEALREENVVAVSTVEEIATELQVAQTELIAAQQNRELAMVELEQAEADRSRRFVTSPIAGYVLERSLAPGEFWTGQDPVVVIAAVEELHVEAIVPISAYGLVAVGAAAIVEPEAPVGGRHEATVSVVDQVFDAASGTFGVRLTLSNTDRSVPAGLRCTVTFAEATPGGQR